MPFSQADITANRDYFAHKLSALKGKIDVVKKAQTGEGDFLLLDSRPRGAYEKAHIRGAISLPFEEIDRLASQLPRDKELVTYCWNDY